MRFAEPKENVKQCKIEESSIVADFGAGGGEYTLACARIVGDTGTVYAIDIQQELLSRIKNSAHKEGLYNVETLWGSIEEIQGSGLNDKMVDVVIVSNVLFLLEDKDTCVQEISRVLKRNGKVVVIDWKDSFNGLGPRAQSIVTLLEVKDLFKKHNFNLLHEIQAGAHHYGAVFKRTVEQKNSKM